MNRKRVTLAVAGAVLVATLATGCEDGPECLSGHTEVHLIPVFNGKTTTMTPVTEFECDEYAKETPNG
ncbi:hypothetical protein HOS59_gp47 [Streptomyces phage Rowa]|uniref:Lipoprotein n=1 Tax=Streptomyces phage Rowa TaxID=2059883 RepID=A0A2H5BM02_9CAUD|nr:hypothetical protein HOS59_gp47 [Streptomyces phage Rowa]AUG87311.1 hypothetical protein SEA_ROWA_47 [Streptomyces phage Rowa]